MVGVTRKRERESDRIPPPPHVRLGLSFAHLDHRSSRPSILAISFSHPTQYLSIMAAVVAPTPAGHPFERVNLVHSRDWPSKDTTRSQDGHDKVRFFQDRLDTGARVLGG
jgi:hypothetical protein